MRAHRLAKCPLAATWISFSIVAACLSACGQEPTPKWTPFAAKLIVHTDGDYSVDMIESYARNSQGSSYERGQVSSSRLPVTGLIDVVKIHDAEKHLDYLLDMSRRTVQTAVGGVRLAEPPLRPMTATEFHEFHAADEPLGKRTIAGVECEGYRVPSKHKKKAF